MKKMVVFLACFFLFLAGCSKSADITYESMAEMAESEPVFLDDSEESDSNLAGFNGSSRKDKMPFVEKKLIKNAFLIFKTDDVKATSEKINSALSQYKGYVANESSEDNNGRVDVSMTVRIPAKAFDEFLASISVGVRHFDRKEITTDDVTTQFVDMDARLRVKKEAEERYLQILKQAKDVKDILEVENQIQMLRSDIESLEGQLRYLSNQVGYSTVNIRYYYYGESSTNAGFLHDIWYALKRGGHGFYDLIIGIITIWPLFIIAGAVFVGGRAIFRRRKTGSKK